jgi:hypothetical protein
MLKLKRMSQYTCGLLITVAASLGVQAAGCGSGSTPGAANSATADAGAFNATLLSGPSTCTAARVGDHAKIVFSAALDCREESGGASAEGSCALYPLTLNATSEVDPTTGVSTARWAITRGPTAILTNTWRSAGGSTSAEMEFGTAFQGIHRVAITDDGTTLIGNVDGRPIAAADIGNPRSKGFEFADHLAPPAIQVTAALQQAISRLLDKATRDAPIVCPSSSDAHGGPATAPAIAVLRTALSHAIGSNQANPAARQQTKTAPSKLQQTIAAPPVARPQQTKTAPVKPGLAALAQDLTAPRPGLSGLRLEDAPLGFWASPVSGVSDQNNAAQWLTHDCQSCARSCATDIFCEAAPGCEELCIAGCFIPIIGGCAEHPCLVAGIASCDSDQSCCGSICCGSGSVCGNDPNADGVCCPSDHPVACGDVTQQGCYVAGSTCCGSLNAACNPGDVCTDPNGPTCCPASQACGGACCGPGQSCQQTSTGANVCCGGTLCGDQCCDSGGTCTNGTCCLGAIDANGNCCPGGLASTVCGNGQCCNGACVADGSCCPFGSQVCGSACCPSGQVCLDPNSSACGVPAQPSLQLIDLAFDSVLGQSGGPQQVFVTDQTALKVNGQGYLPGLVVTFSVDSTSGAQVTTALADGGGNLVGVPVSFFMFSAGAHQLVGWQTAADGSIVQTSLSVFVEILQ